MKNILLLGVSVLAVVAVPVFARAEEAATSTPPWKFATTIGFASEYSFRGLSQSNEGPAMQGSMDVAHDSGFYAGIWGSNVEFTDASLEADIYAGYAGELAQGLTYDIGVIYYAYPGADSDLEYDYVEGALSVGYNFDVAAVTAGVNYSPEFFADSGEATYLSAGIDVPLPFLPLDTKLTGNIGHQWIDDNIAYGVDDYTDWGIGLAAKVEGFDLSLKYIDTSLDETADCADGCEERVIFAVSKTFP